MKPKPLMLMILDGWGYRESAKDNAIETGNTPNWHRLWNEYPHTTLACSGEAVGLPLGTMGNSEVGHLNIGAGRVVYQDFTRINKAIKDGSFFKNEVLRDCFKKVIAAKGALHFMGLCSDIGVHAHIDHLFALMDYAKSAGVFKVFIHCFMDGRDSPPTSGAGYLEKIEQKISEIGNARIATVMGRYYAMDRDKRWDRIEKAYRAIVDGFGISALSPAEAICRSYDKGETDEFVVPTVITEHGKPVATMEGGDGVVFFNFRSDRAREITRAIALENFDGFKRERVPKLSSYVCMTEYDETFSLPIAFPPEKLINILGDVLSEAGLKQLRIAETEKYAHVTFFFNGGEEKMFPGEERVLIPSPREVPTYDKKPEMSAYLVTDEVIKRIDSGAYDVIILNFANGDMVGHTGIMEAAVKAVEAVDSCIARIVPAVLGKGGALFITADHGNCEEMKDDHGGPMTAHTTDPVPLIYISNPPTPPFDKGGGISNSPFEKGGGISNSPFDKGGQGGFKLRTGGGLCDIAPTMLGLLKIEKPKEMTGESLIVSL